jgi:hypothetical protein
MSISVSSQSSSISVSVIVRSMGASKVEVVMV